MIPEMVQLAKFSKQHVPEQHPKVTYTESCDVANQSLKLQILHVVSQ